MAPERVTLQPCSNKYCNSCGFLLVQCHVSSSATTIELHKHLGRVGVIVHRAPTDEQAYCQLSMKENTETTKDTKHQILYIHILMRDERKKQTRSNKQSTPKAVTFPKTNELPRVV